MLDIDALRTDDAGNKGDDVGDVPMQHRDSEIRVQRLDHLREVDRVGNIACKQEIGNLLRSHDRTVFLAFRRRSAEVRHGDDIFKTDDVAGGEVGDIFGYFS